MNEELMERIREFNRKAKIAKRDGYTVAEGYVWEGWGNPTGPCARKVCKVEDYEHAYDAFFYEMGNHEYHINYEGDWDVLSCFGLNDDVCEYEDGKDVDEYMDAMGLSPVTKAAYHDARGDFLRIASEKGWY